MSSRAWSYLGKWETTRLATTRPKVRAGNGSPGDRAATGTSGTWARASRSIATDGSTPTRAPRSTAVLAAAAATPVPVPTSSTASSGAGPTRSTRSRATGSNAGCQERSYEVATSSYDCQPDTSRTLERRTLTCLSSANAREGRKQQVSAARQAPRKEGVMQGVVLGIIVIAGLVGVARWE